MCCMRENNGDNTQLSSLPKRSLKQDQRIIFSYAAIRKLMAEIDQAENKVRELHESLAKELTHLKELSN